jgi:hypothetical protein
MLGKVTFLAVTEPRLNILHCSGLLTILGLQAPRFLYFRGVRAVAKSAYYLRHVIPVSLKSAILLLISRNLIFIGGAGTLVRIINTVSSNLAKCLYNCSFSWFITVTVQKPVCSCFLLLMVVALIPFTSSRLMFTVTALMYDINHTVLTWSEN